VEPSGNRITEPPTHAVGKAAEPATMTDEPPAVAVEDDVDSVSPEPSSLVESVTRAAREIRLCEHLEHAALRWRSPQRKLELSHLVEPEEAETKNPHRHLQVEAALPGWRGHDHKRGLCAFHLRPEDAVIEAVEASASPAPAGHDQHAGERSRRGLRRHGEQHDRKQADDGDDGRQAKGICRGDADAERREQGVWRRSEASWDHGATRSLS